MTSYRLIGLMSGTSLDGIDLADVRFERSGNGSWSFEIQSAETFLYHAYLQQQLANCTRLSGEELTLLNHQLALHFADAIEDFIESYQIHRSEINAIASHGHTVFHQPEKGFTLQIGCGTTLARKTGIPVINDFRSRDVAHGGQGAPLVPIGDALLFAEMAESFLNIGGICNLSVPGDRTVAYDVCTGNLPINRLMDQHFNLPFDKDGLVAASGKVNVKLLDALNNIPYFKESGPKSLGVEWIATEFVPILDKTDLSAPDKISTIVEHTAFQIANSLLAHNVNSVLVTGGGARNRYVIERIQHYFHGRVILPDEELIECKEAIIFAFLGALYLANEPNCLSSVTGAHQDVRGGTFHAP